MDILTRNYYCLLRNGAFAGNEPLEPMSQYKWRKVTAMAVSDGVAHHLPEAYRTMTKGAKATTAGIPDAHGRRLRRLTANERHSMDCSVATLELLNIIMYNIEQTVNRHTSLRAMIDMGLFLRARGDKVDYIKLELWLRKLHVRRMAELHAGILIATMGFQMRELPFVKRYDTWAERLIVSDRRLTARCLFRYPLTTLRSWLTALWRVVTQIEE